MAMDNRRAAGRTCGARHARVGRAARARTSPDRVGRAWDSVRDRGATSRTCRRQTPARPDARARRRRAVQPRPPARGREARPREHPRDRPDRRRQEHADQRDLPQAAGHDRHRQAGDEGDRALRGPRGPGDALRHEGRRARRLQALGHPRLQAADRQAAQGPARGAHPPALVLHGRRPDARGGLRRRDHARARARRSR